MKKGLKITLVIIAVLLILAILFFIIDNIRVQKQEQIESYEEILERNSRKAIMKAVVVKVADNHLMVLDVEEEFGLITVGFDENIGFKQGQEIAISFDGMIITTYPGQLGNVEKIEIIKEKSEKKIPDEILRYCYSSYDNVKVTIAELTSTGITLTIEDSNELPYQYSHSYIINQKVKDETYTGVGQKIGENTGNSTAGFTRDRLRIYLERSK